MNCEAVKKNFINFFTTAKKVHYCEKRRCILQFALLVFQHSRFLLVVTWNRTYIFVVLRYRVIFSPRLEFSPSCVVASSRKFQLAASQNYTLFAYNLIILCLRYCDFLVFADGNL